MAALEVLHVYSGNLFGGIETLLLTLARKRGEAPDMNPSFALCFEGRLSRGLDEAGVTRYPLPAVRLSRPWTVWRARRALREVLSLRRFDAVICHSVWAQAVFGPTVRRAGVKLAFWLHDAAAGRHWLERLAALTPPDRALCNSRYVEGTLGQLYPHAPSTLFYYPVEDAAPERLQRGRAVLRAECQTREEDVVIVQHCRLEEWKGHRVLVEALGLLKDVPGWVYWQVGGAQREHEKAYLAELQARARQLGIAERIRYLGQRGDVPELLRAADIHCQPNPTPEPFGIAFIEALYAGLPVVATRIGGAAEIVTPECGVLVEPRDSQALAEALRRLVMEPASREKLGRAGPARARALCEPRAQLERLEKTLREL